MKRFAVSLFIAALTITSLTVHAQGGLGRAIAEELGAITLSDAQVADYSKQGVAQMDAQTPVAAPGDPYAQRLERIVARHHTISGVPVNYKVYLIKDVNAFAAGDGSVRVFKGLMDMMTDGELIAVIGHEMGHVVHRDTHTAMKRSLQQAAIRDGLGAISPAAGRFSQSQAAAVFSGLVGAKFSRAQETAADDYSYGFLKKNGYNVMALATSFEKLAKLGGGGGTLEFLSDHPDSAKRAQRVRDHARRDGLAR